MSLSGKTMFISGASRGIGLAIAKKAAADPANIARVAKTAVLNKPARTYTGRSLLCEDVLLESGVADLSVYDCVPGAELGLDLWVDAPAKLPELSISWGREVDLFAGGTHQVPGPVVDRARRECPAGDSSR
jgi:hypothetical protein